MVAADTFSVGVALVVMVAFWAMRSLRALSRAGMGLSNDAPRNPELTLSALNARHRRPQHAAVTHQSLVLPTTCAVVETPAEQGDAPSSVAVVDSASLSPGCCPALVLVNRGSGGQSVPACSFQQCVARHIICRSSIL